MSMGMSLLAFALPQIHIALPDAARGRDINEGLPIGFVLTKFATFEVYLWFNLEYNAR